MRLVRSNSFRRALSRRQPERPDASGDEDVLASGHATKLTAPNKWQKCYCVAYSSSLLLLKDRKDWTPFRSFPDEVVWLPNVAVTIEDCGMTHEHSVVLQAGSQRQAISFSSREEALHWLEILKRASTLPGCGAALETSSGPTCSCDEANVAENDAEAEGELLRLEVARKRLDNSMQRQSQLLRRLAQIEAEAADDFRRCAEMEAQCRSIRDRASALLSSPTHARNRDTTSA
ncbi:hypothetical protein AB1Y20_001622 [Prymnesium parvum]|uniref:PH domain-containing protein n=1 Tax=Prymnesium parvum TaxID=97485 RepID=A0AB34KBW2_PRYPA